MCVRVVYSVVQMEYILWDGRRIPDPIVWRGGALKLQDILQKGEKKSATSWLVNKEEMNAFYEATKQVELCRSSGSRSMFEDGYRSNQSDRS